MMREFRPLDILGTKTVSFLCDSIEPVLNYKINVRKPNKI